MKVKFIKIFIMLFIALGIVGCFENGEIEQKDPILYLVAENHILFVDDEKEIEYYVDNLEEFEMNFETSDETVFKVEDEKIIAVGTGTATLKVSIVGYEEIFEEASVKVIQEGFGEKPEHTIILDYVKAEIGTDLFEAKLFPTSHPAYKDAKITFESSKPELISNKGLLYPSDYDEKAIIKITVDYYGVEKSIDHEVIVVGSIPNTIANDFLHQFYNIVTSDIAVNYFKDKYPDAVIEYRSSNEAVLSNTGKFTKPEKDTFFTIYAIIEIPSIGYSREFSKSVKGLGLSVSEKAQEVKVDIINQLGLTSGLISSDLTLPTSEERYNGTITWTSNYPEVLSNEGKVYQPLVNQLIELRGTIQFDNGKSSFVLDLEVVGEQLLNKWDNIEEFLERYIFTDEVKTLKYSVMGIADPYTAYNDGYILFYENKDLEVIESLIASGPQLGTYEGETKYRTFRPGTPMEVKWVTVHDTAGNNEGSTAKAIGNYIHSVNRVISSWHYTIDDHELYLHVPLSEMAYHAGESTGNRYSIGIETCTNKGGDYDLVIRRTAKLVAKLLDEFDLTLRDVKQHYDWSGKNCPQVIRASNRWGELINLIGMELFARQNLGDVKFEWKSLSPTILDDTGKVFAHPGPASQISYQVTVTYNNESRTYNHTTTLQAKK